MKDRLHQTTGAAEAEPAALESATGNTRTGAPAALLHCHRAQALAAALSFLLHTVVPGNIRVLSSCTGSRVGYSESRMHMDSAYGVGERFCPSLVFTGKRYLMDPEPGSDV